MIPVSPMPEPANFDETVRSPGRQYLKKYGIRKQGDTAGRRILWSADKADYWRRCSAELIQEYRSICCYVAMKINRDPGEHDRHTSVEHFVPKSKEPWLAYEWTNYRLASRKANRDRGDRNVLDPFAVEADDFLLMLATGVIYPNPALSESRQKVVMETIENLKLNDPYWQELRLKYYSYYLANLQNFDQAEMETFLWDNAPIVLAQLKRPIATMIVEED